MKRGTTAVPAELGAPTCNYRNRHGGTLTVPRGLGLLATRLCHDAQDPTPRFPCEARRKWTG